MSFSIPATIRALAMSLLASEYRLSCSAPLWREGLAELCRRGRGSRETGAFLLGQCTSALGRHRRHVTRFIYYDDLDPHCLDTGIIVFDGAGYGPLWETCRETGLSVIGDVHTHPGIACQSDADRRHPMIATPGHIAVIVPDYAERPVRVEELGLYEYKGSHEWNDHSGERAGRFFRIGIFG